MRLARSIVLSALAFLGVSAGLASEKELLRSSLVTVEGRVVEVGRQAGEGDLEVLSVRLQVDASGGEELQLLLAPAHVLEETGFEVEKGDRLRARIFPSEQGPSKVHKALNLTRHTMLRFRTLHQIPLWDGMGAWQGGKGRATHQGRGPGTGRGQGGGPGR